MRFRFTVLCLFSIAVFILSGCIEKTFAPKADLTVTSVDPYYVEWIREGGGGGETEGAEDAILSLPSVKISLRNNSGIPANLKGTSISYTTMLGEPIDQLFPYKRNQEIKLEASSDIEFDVAFDYLPILALTGKVTSNIYPISARIFIEIKDVNGNVQGIKAHCLILDPEASVSANPPSTQPTPEPPEPTPEPTPVPTLRIAQPQDGSDHVMDTNVSFVGIASPSNSVSDITWISDPPVDFTPQGNLSTSATFPEVEEYEITLSANVSGTELSDRIKIQITQ